MAGLERKKSVSFDEGAGKAEAAAKAAAKPKDKLIPKPHNDWRLPDQYEVKTMIGTGSYGSVAEAYDRVNKRLVAIKKVHQVFEDLVDCKRILREIAILNRLANSGVVSLYDIIVPEDLMHFNDLFLVLEICDSDLKKLAKTPVHLTMEHINLVMYNLLVAVKYLHSAGIYHRDLKPANCLVNQDCTLKVCDFGLSRAVALEAQPHLDAPPMSPRPNESDASTAAATSAPIVPPTMRMKRTLTSHVVTRWYRAPELILLQEDYTEAIDIWSVGCIYAELLGMIKENVENPKDRSAIFPGSSCFPLSPDHRHHSSLSRGNRDQLSVIFSLLGTPSDQEVEDLTSAEARKYVRGFPKQPPKDLRTRFPGTDDEHLELLRTMLQFSPKKRAPISKLLESSVFSDIRKPEFEAAAESRERIFLEFELEEKLDEKALRKHFLLEIQKFHPEVQIPDALL